MCENYLIKLSPDNEGTSQPHLNYALNCTPNCFANTLHTHTHTHPIKITHHEHPPHYTHTHTHLSDNCAQAIWHHIHSSKRGQKYDELPREWHKSLCWLYTFLFHSANIFLLHSFFEIHRPRYYIWFIKAKANMFSKLSARKKIIYYVGQRALMVRCRSVSTAW